MGREGTPAESVCVQDDGSVMTPLATRRAYALLVLSGDGVYDLCEPHSFRVSRSAVRECGSAVQRCRAGSTGTGCRAQITWRTSCSSCRRPFLCLPRPTRMRPLVRRRTGGPGCVESCTTTIQWENPSRRVPTKAVQAPGQGFAQSAKGMGSTDQTVTPVAVASASIFAPRSVSPAPALAYGLVLSRR